MMCFRERGDKAEQLGAEWKSYSADCKPTVDAKRWQGGRYMPWSCPYSLCPSPRERGVPWECILYARAFQTPAKSCCHRDVAGSTHSDCFPGTRA